MSERNTKSRATMCIPLPFLNELFALLASKTLNITDIMVLLIISKYGWNMKEKHYECKLNALNIAEEIDVNERTVLRSLNKLKREGLITQIYRLKKGKKIVKTKHKHVMEQRTSLGYFNLKSAFLGPEKIKIIMSKSQNQQTKK